MHVLCDFSMFCLNFYTLLDQYGLTYSLNAPSCQFLFSAVFVFQVFWLFKVVRKIQKNQIKNQRDGTFQNHQSMEGGSPPGNQEGAWRGPTLGRARGPPGCPVGPLSPPFAYIYPSSGNPWKQNPFSRNPLCSTDAAVSRSGLPGEAAPAPCRKDTPPPGDPPSPWTPPGCAVSSPA